MANPIFNNMLNSNSSDADLALESKVMTVSGSVNKTVFLLAMVVLSAFYTWNQAMAGFSDKVSMLMMGGLVVGFILAMIIIFTRKALPVLTPIYAVCEGFFLGGISAVYAGEYAGIVIQAILATFATLFAMLILFKTRLITCTEKFRSVIFTATASVALIYLIQIVASLFGRGIPQIFTASPIGIGFSVIVVLIAAFNLIVDFDFIERGANEMIPVEYEWYGAFGLVVSLVWLYLEMLRLLAKLSSRN